VRRKRESTARVEYTGPRSPVSSYIQLKYDEMEGNVWSFRHDICIGCRPSTL